MYIHILRGTHLNKGDSVRIWIEKRPAGVLIWPLLSRVLPPSAAALVWDELFLEHCTVGSEPYRDDPLPKELEVTLV